MAPASTSAKSRRLASAPAPTTPTPWKPSPDGSQSKLSRAALKPRRVATGSPPPAPRCRRCVASTSTAMRTLVARGLVAEAGEEPSTGAHLYVTTNMFLELLGIESLDALPDLAPLLPDVDLIDEPDY